MDSVSFQNHSATRIVKIIDEEEGESVNIKVTSNVISKRTFYENFASESTLVYRIPEAKEPFLLNTTDESIVLEDKIDTYYVRTPKSNKSTSTGAVPKITGKKLLHFQDVMETMYKDKASLERTGKKTLSEMKIANKRQNEEKIQELEQKKRCIRRIAYVFWKHRKDDTSQYEAMGKIVGGGKMKVTLDGNKNYTFQNLKELLLLVYMNEDNKPYFQSSTVNLANTDESIFTSYACNGKQFESFWEFSRIFPLRKSNNNLIILILTTKKKDSSVVSQEIIEKKKTNFLSSHSSSVIKKDAMDTTASSTQNRPSTDASKVWKRPLDCKQVKFKDTQSKHLSSAVISAGKEVGIKSPRKVLVETENKKEHSNNESRNLMTNEISFPSPSYSLIKENEVEEKKKWSLFPSSYSSTDENAAFVRPQDITDKKMDSLQVPIHVIKSSDVRFTDEVLGQGAQGIVMKAIYMGVFVAVKCIQKRKDNKLALREIAILHRLRHPFIINIMGAYANVSQMFVVMEYFPSDSLFDVLFDKKVRVKYNMTLENKIKIAKTIAYAIAFLHKQKSQIIHRDIKPNNILVNQEINAKLCDLGLASTESIDRSLQSTQKGNIRGTYLFLAPEILLNNNDATTNSDIWSFACTLVELFSEESVWNTKDFNDGYLCAFRNLEKKNVPKLDKLPIFLQSIVKQCFNYAPNMRPSFDDLINSFEKINI